MDHRQHHMETVRSFLSVLTYPLQYVASFPVSASHWMAETLATRDRLQKQNARYREENLLLQARLQKLIALEAENMRLRDLVESSFKIGDRALIAELVAVNMDPYKHQVLINKGSRSGAFVGQAVLDANAVMGQVTHISPLTSTVLMITDASHALPVQISRNGLRTIAVGTGRIHQLELPHLPNNADILEGDLLVTSGLGGHFPQGYPVAVVTSVTQDPGEPFLTAIATPSAHLERSREVLLVWTLAPPVNPASDPEPSTESEIADSEVAER